MAPRITRAGWENRSGPGGAGNTNRSLNHLSDSTGKGSLAMVEHPEPARDTSSEETIRILCPVCARFAVKAILTRDDSIREATYQCPSAHVFTMRWLAA